MPTGYTDAVENGTVKTLEAYALRCARAFSPLILMRDEPINAPFPEKFESSGVYKSFRVIAERRLEWLKTLDEASIEREADKWKSDRVHTYLQYAEQHTLSTNRYREMRAKVEAWIPPTPEHTKLKAFMLEQLDISIGDELSHEPLALPSAAEWYDREVSRCRLDIQTYSQEEKKEEERLASRNKWLSDLRESVKGL